MASQHVRQLKRDACTPPSEYFGLLRIMNTVGTVPGMRGQRFDTQTKRPIMRSQLGRNASMRLKASMLARAAGRKEFGAAPDRSVYLRPSRIAPRVITFAWLIHATQRSRTGLAELRSVHCVIPGPEGCVHKANLGT